MIIDQATELRQLVRKGRQDPSDHAARAASSAALSRLLLVTAGKPGVGASTAAVHLAMALQAAGRETLLVDADPQNAGATALCGLEGRPALGDVLTGRRNCGETICPGPGNTHVLPGGASADSTHLWTEPAQMRLTAALRSPELPFDAVVVDGGCFHGGLPQAIVRRFWQAADAVVVVSSSEISAVMDAYAAIKQMAEARSRAPIWTLVSRADSGELARDVHGRLSRACQRFLEITIADGGWLPALPAGQLGQPTAETTRLHLARLVEAIRAPTLAPNASERQRP